MDLSRLTNSLDILIDYLQNHMIERLNEMETDENINEAAASIFKEVVGFKSGYAQGLGHSVILEPFPSLQKNKDLSVWPRRMKGTGVAQRITRLN